MMLIYVLISLIMLGLGAMAIIPMMLLLMATQKIVNEEG